MHCKTDLKDLSVEDTQQKKSNSKNILTFTFNKTHLKDFRIEDNDNSQRQVEGSNGRVDSVTPVLSDNSLACLSTSRTILPAKQGRYRDTD